jgi:hypothetical protein
VKFTDEFLLAASRHPKAACSRQRILKGKPVTTVPIRLDIKQQESELDDHKLQDDTPEEEDEDEEGEKESEESSTSTKPKIRRGRRNKITPGMR